MGPQNGEPLCPCAMRAANRATSPPGVNVEKLRESFRKLAEFEAQPEVVASFARIEQHGTFSISEAHTAFGIGEEQ